MKPLILNGSPSSGIFLSVFTVCALYMVFFNDYSRLEFQSPVKLGSSDAVFYDPSAGSSSFIETLNSAVTDPLPETDNDAAPMVDVPSADVRDYVKKYAGLAVEEMRRTGIPASISMAQAIVESRAGRSGLALTANNHFGIKCGIKAKCATGHCINFTDDVDKDYFRLYQNPYRSWKDHSEFLKKDRYARCFKQTSYQGWAKALKACGYATATNYAQTLITTIEKYKLYLLDTK